jgi:ABC-type glucose/galactose transport system permease subunit
MQWPSVSVEAAIGLSQPVGLVEMNWELRGLGVLITIGLAVHIAKQLDLSIFRKVALAAVLIGIMVIGTHHQIWLSFHDDFPSYNQ